MSDIARRLYPLDDTEVAAGLNDPLYWRGGYQPIIEHFGRVLFQVEEDNYSGDSLVLLGDDGEGYGYLQFGWGSCSGCDSLQACATYQQIGELIEDLRSRVQRMSREAVVRFLKEHDWEGDYTDKDLAARFVAGSLDALERDINVTSPEQAK